MNIILTEFKGDLEKSHKTDDNLTFFSQLSIQPFEQKKKKKIIWPEKDLLEQNNAIDYRDLIHVHRLLHPTTTDNILFKCTRCFPQDRPYTGP